MDSNPKSELSLERVYRWSYGAAGLARFSSRRNRTLNADGTRLPNFLIIGAPKSATSSLSAYLAQHPEIFLSAPKEPHFLAFHKEKPAFGGMRPKREWLNVNAVTDFDDYRRLFEKAGTARAIGEASTNYLYFEQAIEGIKTYVPDARMLAVLRNPVDRAYSAFLHLFNEGRESASGFTRALDLEEQRIAENWSPLYRYRAVGRYSHQLGRYYAAFDRNRIKVILYDDLSKGLNGVLQDIFRFLDVNGDFSPNVSTRYRQGGIPRLPAVHKLLASQHPARVILPKPLRRKIWMVAQQVNLTRPEPMADELRRTLTLDFRDDILRLQDLIGRDLSVWLKTP